jgi:U3 small nucleolar RNA-associated protein 10
VCIGALELLSERIPKISDHVRREVVTTTNGIVDLIIKVLAQDNILLRIHCLKALKAIASTLVPKEETALTTALSTTLVALRVPELMLHALDVIIPLSYVLSIQGSPFL